MSAGMYGANPEQLSGLGKQLQTQGEAAQNIHNVITLLLAGTEWSGPARDAFQAQWEGQWKTALGNIQEALTASGTDCCTRALSLAQVMGVGAQAG